jgi:hypothetical protein
MDIDLAALPDDVETLRQMVRSLAAEPTILCDAQAEIERLRLIVQSCSASCLAGALNGSMMSNFSSALKTWKPISRGPRPSSRQVPRRPPEPRREPIGRACRRTYRARTGGSTSSTTRAPAAAARCT